ncbi:MAG: hypothetical protein ACRC57_13365 [Sarcina sp.]
MLIKILNLDLTDATLAALKLGFFLDDGSTITTDSIANFSQANFVLKDTNGSGTTPITWDATAVTPDDTAKTLVLKFLKTALAVGDLLSIEPSATLVTGVSLISNTASYLYQQAGTNTTSSDTAALAPKPTTTATENYNLVINFIDSAGNPVSVVNQLAAPFTVNGTVVASITVTGTFSGNFNADAQVPFTVEYFDALNRPLVLDAASSSTISIFTKKA